MFISFIAIKGYRLFQRQAYLSETERWLNEIQIYLVDLRSFKIERVNPALTIEDRYC